MSINIASPSNLLFVHLSHIESINYCLIGRKTMRVLRIIGCHRCVKSEYTYGQLDFDEILDEVICFTLFLVPKYDF